MEDEPFNAYFSTVRGSYSRFVVSEKKILLNTTRSQKIKFINNVYFV